VSGFGRSNGNLDISKNDRIQALVCPARKIS
jgi:hypothetical protein